MYHCQRVTTLYTMYLFSNEAFIHRFAKVGICPRCGKTVIEVHSECRITRKRVIKRMSGKKADNFLKNTTPDFVTGTQKKSKYTVGWVFGVNQELKNGEIKQFAQDFYGNRKLIKKIKS